MLFRLILTTALFGLSLSPAFALTPDEVQAVLEELDKRQQNSGDWKARIFIDQKEKNKNDKSEDEHTNTNNKKKEKNRNINKKNTKNRNNN